MSRFFEGAFVVILIGDIVVFIGYIFIYYCLDNNSEDKIFDL